MSLKKKTKTFIFSLLVVLETRKGPLVVASEPSPWLLPAGERRYRTSGLGTQTQTPLAEHMGTSCAQTQQTATVFTKYIEQHLSLHKGLTPEAAELSVSSSTALD